MAIPIIHTVHPGDVFLAVHGERFETLLGSCVAVILTDPSRSVGVMCHIVHSRTPCISSYNDSTYAVNAMRVMFGRLREVGITPEYCDAYVFGGGNMFPKIFGDRHVGAANVCWVREFLATHGIVIVAESVGNDCYRKIGWTVGEAELEIECVWSEQQQVC